MRKRIALISSRHICRDHRKIYIEQSVYFSIIEEKYLFLLTYFYIFDIAQSRFVHSDFSI